MILQAIQWYWGLQQSSVTVIQQNYNQFKLNICTIALTYVHIEKL